LLWGCCRCNCCACFACARARRYRVARSLAAIGETVFFRWRSCYRRLFVSPRDSMSHNSWIFNPWLRLAALRRQEAQEQRQLMRLSLPFSLPNNMWVRRNFQWPSPCNPSSPTFQILFFFFSWPVSVSLSFLCCRPWFRV